MKKGINERLYTNVCLCPNVFINNLLNSLASINIGIVIKVISSMFDEVIVKMY